MKKAILILLMLATSIITFSQKIQRTTGDTLVLDSNNKLRTASLAPTDYGTWRKIWLKGDHVYWRGVTQTPWRVFSYGAAVIKGKKDQYRVCITVVDSNGVSIPDAKVTFVDTKMYGKKPLQYDTREMAYISTIKVAVLTDHIDITVEYGGIKRTVFVNSDNYHSDYYYSDKYINNSSSWIVMDKNMYRPGDTIKWKVVGVSPKSGSILSNDSVDVFLYFGQKRYTLFSGRFNIRGVVFGESLVDTFKLISDRYYSIQSYYYCEDKPATHLASTGFTYKDYELNDIVVKCKYDKSYYLWGDSIRFTFNATDEKGDYLDNGVVKCQLNINNIDRIYKESLWYQNKLTDTLSAPVHRGVAEIVVSTAKWLDADFSVSGRWNYRSADGMERNGSVSFGFRRDSLPTEPVKSNEFLSVTGFKTMNTADSVGFSAVAPIDPVTAKSRPFRWIIYRNAKYLTSGIDTLLNWRNAETGNANYYCFIFGDGIIDDSESIRHGKYGLNVEVVQQNSVTPGSVDDIIVRVTDNKGKPVKGVDVTALGYTKKLDRALAMPQNWEWRKKSYDRAIEPIVGFDIEEHGDSVIKEPWLVELLHADSTQYWQLAHNNTDSVRIIRSRSGVNKPQIVPVLVRDGKIMCISRLDIDFEPVWVTGTTNDRYVFVLKPGSSHHFNFHVGDTVYSCFVNNIKIGSGEKAWLSVPASACSKSNHYNSNRMMQNDIANSRVSVRAYPVNGNAYIHVEGDDSLVRRLASFDVMNKKIGNKNIYSEMRLDGPTAEFPFLIYGDKVVYYSADRMMMVYEKCQNGNVTKNPKKDKYVLVEQTFPCLDDSLCTTAEIKADWVSKVDNRRSTTDLMSYFDYSNNATYIVLYNAENEEKPVNIIYRAVGDSTEYVVGGSSRYHINMLKGKRYEMTFLYKNARARTLFIDVNQEGHHIVKSSLDSSMTVVHNDKTIHLEDSIRHEYEKKMAYNYHFNPESFVYENYFYEDGTLDEVMVVAYGTSTRKSKPMMMKSAAPEANSIRIRGVGSVNSDASYDDMVMMEEADGYAMAAPIAEPEEEIIIRDNFNDVAFWQPDLVTDKNGEVRFAITYPDDLTEWREAFVAIKGRQRGYVMTSVIARKDEVAKLKMPRFAVVGDSVSAIGTGVNYITGASAVDTIYAVAEGDSLCMQYIFGHDGEKRCSPVFAQGMEARDANFYIVEGDTSFTLKYNKTIFSQMEVNVYTDIREALINRVKELAKADWCGSNDYLALRLEAMRMVADTDYTKEIDQIEKKLMANRMDNGFWCWYGKGENTGSASLWVTEQVLSALGNKAAANNNFLSFIGSYFAIYRNQRNWCRMFEVAKLFDIIGDTLQRNLRLDEIPADSLAKYDRSALIEYQIMRGQDVKFDTMRHRTYTDGEYYTLNPKRRCCWFNPIYEQIETSLLAYRYYSMRGDVARCRAIKFWLMQYVRNRGRFGISLSESLSLKIVKALWQDDKVGVRDLLYQLSIDNKIASELPYSTVVTDDAKLEYKGKRTLYVSTEQKYWEEDPEVVSNGMTIKSEYVAVNKKENRSVIKVDVTLEADAEYLVISIPIPAGCSYDETTYSYTRGESHREEYKDRVNIFCERIGEGTHHFEVPLNERYPGVYTVNPSEVHLIYFPAFNANWKKTKVRL